MKMVKYLLMNFYSLIVRLFNVFSAEYTLIVAFLCDFCQIISALRFQSIILNLNGFIQVMNGAFGMIRYHRQGSRGLKCHY
ncbi:hypothetical protein D6L40_09620 [Vibrio alginolyticus]|nr:hypothetical protein [Vibrio alginolyticus]EGQ8983330.1 hypothetical protein [Vibrio alginolyticus]EGR0026173.1 hypothetical protein [Vibrio alginolyticus]EGR0304134.1 hypothetical protein [Vibrio alginolyticus]EGR1571747.1 hypothetical protein [Vibrio alginolyticus]